MQLPHEALGERIVELSAHIDAAKSRLLELIFEFDEMGGWADQGALTCAHWLNFACGVRLESARDDRLTDSEWGVAGTPAPSFGASRADALMELIDGDNPDTEIVVLVSAETLRDDCDEGCCQMEDDPALPPETARRPACDAGVVRLVEGPDGQPLDVGRRMRAIPPSLRRALKVRDGGCRLTDVSADGCFR